MAKYACENIHTYTRVTSETFEDSSLREGLSSSLLVFLARRIASINVGSTQLTANVRHASNRPVKDPALVDSAKAEVPVTSLADMDRWSRLCQQLLGNLTAAHSRLLTCSRNITMISWSVSLPQVYEVESLRGIVHKEWEPTHPRKTLDEAYLPDCYGHPSDGL